MGGSTKNPNTIWRVSLTGKAAVLKTAVSVAPASEFKSLALRH